MSIPADFRSNRSNNLRRGGIDQALIRKCTNGVCEGNAQYPVSIDYSGDVAYLNWQDIEEDAEYRLYVTFSSGSKERVCPVGYIDKHIRTGSGKTSLTLDDCLNASTTPTATFSYSPTPTPTRTVSVNQTPTQTQTTTIMTTPPQNGTQSSATVSVRDSSLTVNGAYVELLSKSNSVLGSSSTTNGKTQLSWSYNSANAPYKIRVSKVGYLSQSVALNDWTRVNSSAQFNLGQINLKKYGYQINVTTNNVYPIAGATVSYERRSCAAGICIWKQIESKTTNNGGGVTFTADPNRAVKYRAKITKSGFQTKYINLVYPTTMTSGLFVIKADMVR